LDAGALIRRLGVSKALISMSLKDLQQYGVIEAAGRSLEGTQLYRANPDLARVISGVLENRESRLLKRIRNAYLATSALSPETFQRFNLNAQRLHALNDWIESAVR